MGEYLRALGVREMIKVVSQVHEQLLKGVDSPIEHGKKLTEAAGRTHFQLQ